MTLQSVTGTRKNAKPSKPRKDYPLFAHGSGQWAKKVRGKLYYFGVWSDPAAAERKWNRDKEALLDGRNPDIATHGDSLKWLCDAFLESKKLQQERGELTARAFNDYRSACLRLVDSIGRSRRLETIAPADLERYRNDLPTTWGPTTVNNHLRLIRALLKYANDIDATPREIKFRIGLKSVPRRKVRQHEASKPEKSFTAAEIWSLLEHSTPPMNAFIMLGINAAYGTADIGRLRTDSINWKTKWLGDLRGKTGFARGCWLWPETIKALKEAIDCRPYSTKHKELFFLTTHRRPWYEDGSTSNPLSIAFRKVKTAAGIDRKGVGHYSLRHVFRTVADDCRDEQAVNYIMGHTDASMAEIYRNGIDPERVKKVCQHVRQWFIDGKPKKKRAAKKGGAK